MTQIYVVVVTYNSCGFIDATLKALDLASDNLSVIVVDNASTDGTTAIVSGHPSVELIANRENVGFAQAVNQALAKIPISSFVLLLNPDAVISGEDVRGLANGFATDPRMGICAPLVRQSQDRMRVMHGGRFPTAWRMFLHQSGLSNFARAGGPFSGHYYHLKNVKRGEILDADWVSGGCMMISPRLRSVLPRLDASWFMYAEDIHYCWAAKQVGYAVKIDTRFTATHEVGGSQSVDSKPSPTWLLNLYDFYRRDLNSNTLGRRIWCESVVWGLRARGVFYVAYSKKPGLARDRSIRRQWERKSEEFFEFARALRRETRLNG